jgi:streptogramin lyase
MRRVALVLTATFVLAACATRAPVSAPLATAPLPILGDPLLAPKVEQGNGFGRWQVYSLSDFGSIVGGIAAGPDRNMWLTADLRGIFRITMGGVATLYPLKFHDGTGFQTIALALGGDNRFYVSSGYDSSSFGAFTTLGPDAGKFAIYRLPGDDIYEAGGLAPGPDGNV